MPRRRARHGLPFTALLLLLAQHSGQADETPPALDASELAPESLEQLSPEARIEALTLRLVGIEGKLKESALARKSADQARMEAERRLAEGLQEIERLGTEIQRLKGAQSELEQALSERGRRIAELDARRLSLETDLAALGQRYEGLRARVPIQDGGALDPEQARRAAREVYLELRELAQRSGGSRDTAQRRDLGAAEDQLHARQFVLARTLNARSLYRIRPHDSLALISSRCYGDSSQWQTLFEANRHVLDDPNQLTPGVTLVVP